MGRDVDEARLSRCLDLIYEAAIAPAGWPVALRNLAQLFGSGFVDIFTRSHDSERFNGLAYGLDRSDYEDEFLNVWFKRNVWGQASPVQTAGEVLSTRDMVDVDALRRSQIYNGYLHPRGLHEGLRLSLWVGDRDIQDVSILRPWSSGAFEAPEVSLGYVLLPHLQRAAAVTRRLGDADVASHLGATSTEPSDVAVILFDRAGVPFRSNATAEALFGTGSVLRLRNGTELWAATPEATRVLHHAIARAVGRAGSVRSGAVVPLPRAGGAGSANLMILPVSRTHDWASSRPPAAVALLRSPDPLSHALVPLKAAFHLTRAEADLARHLLAGGTLIDLASRSGRSLNTIRTHLAHLMDKTGTDKQAGLIRVLASEANGTSSTTASVARAQAPSPGFL